MATRAVPKYFGTRTLSKKYTAKCEANQPLVDKLADKREKAGNSNFAYTLKRAAESICKEKDPITLLDPEPTMEKKGDHNEYSKNDQLSDLDTDIEEEQWTHDRFSFINDHAEVARKAHSMDQSEDDRSSIAQSVP